MRLPLLFGLACGDSRLLHSMQSRLPRLSGRYLFTKGNVQGKKKWWTRHLTHIIGVKSQPRIFGHTFPHSWYQLLVFDLWYNWLVPLFRAFVTSASIVTVWHPIRNLFTSNVGFVSRLPEWRWADKTWWRAIVKRTYKYTGWTLQFTQVKI